MKKNSIEDIIEEKYTRYLNCKTDILDLTLEEAKFILETAERRNYVTSISADSSTLWLITPEKPVVGQDMKNCLKLTWCGKEYYSQPHRTEMILDTLKVSNKIYLAATRRKFYICYIADM